jgi:phage terminase large subunit
MPKIIIPANGWRPRPHQLPLWKYLERGGKRAVEIAHRRWGKDDVALHWAAVSSMMRVGGIFHMLPQYAQARKAIWTAVNPHTGKRRIDEAFPTEIRENVNEQEMFIRFKNGSTWQVVGSDNYDRLVGVSVAGIVFSEWALADPAAWAYLAPVVTENNGYALFITTPRGDNHAKETLDLARSRPLWFAEVSTVVDTQAISHEVIEEQRLEYHSIYGEDAGDALIEQEYYCSFTAAILGAYYAKEMALADAEGRICKIDPVEDVPVNTAWDLGVGDSMSIWFWQAVPGLRGKGEIMVVDYYEASGYGIGHYADLIKAKAKDRGYMRGQDWVPHDARVREQGSWGPDGKAKQRIEVMIECGLKPKVVKQHKLDDGISAVRQTLHRCLWDEERCAPKGLKAIRQYQREWDDEKRIFRDIPLHNWASHCADAKRTMAMAYREIILAEPPPDPRALVIGGPENLPPGMQGVTMEDLWNERKRQKRRRM